MPKSKNAETQEESEDSAREADLHPNGSSAMDGERRGGIDPSLHTLKGYRSWARQVKRNWSEE